MPYRYFTIEQRENLAGLLRSGSDRQPEMRTALERLREPDFGMCELCGAEIPYSRLQARPTERLCARCVL